MNTSSKISITITTVINCPVERVWSLWNTPKHIVRWNTATPEWHTTYATNDLKPGGRFTSRMEAKDGSMGFDFGGTYTKVVPNTETRYKMEDDREVQVIFNSSNNVTEIVETFDAENQNSAELQKAGWQSILDNFKKYCEDDKRSRTIDWSININASPEKVYSVMLDQNHYREWTSEFNPTSHYIGSWEKGKTIKFIGSSEDGKQGGMVSRIKENIAGKYISIEHLGMIQDGKEITEGVEVDSWKGALENYTFTEKDGITTLDVDIDYSDDFKSYFDEVWPKALNKLKEIVER